MPFATKAGKGLFGYSPEVAARDTNAEQIRKAELKTMLPYKFVVRVRWNRERNEPDFLLMNIKPIETEGGAFATCPTAAAWLGVADTL